jgi:HNH endonuclease
MKPNTKLPISERIEKHIVSKENCFLTDLKPIYNEYIQLGIDGKKKLIHRLIYELNYGEIPEGKVVSHSCKNRGCINPAHLFLATPEQMRKTQSSNKGLSKNQGEDHGRAKLNDFIVTEIKTLLSNSNLTTGQIAYLYNVSYDTIYNIKIGRRWKHL